MKLEQFVEEFAQNVSAQTDAILRGDAKAGNRHATRYVKAFKKLEMKLPPELQLLIDKKVVNGN